MGFNCLKATEPLQRGSLLFTTKFPEIPGRKDERLSRPWSHPVVLNLGPPDWESTALTTRPFIQQVYLQNFLIKQDNFNNKWHKNEIKNLFTSYNLLANSINQIK